MLIYIGFTPWKKFFKKFEDGIFVKKNHHNLIKKYAKNNNNKFYFWGDKIEKNLKNFLINKNSYCIEDGFIRSFGLGSDLNKPHSFVIDKRGIYYDSTKTSDLEIILKKIYINFNNKIYIKKLIKKIIKKKINKYNIENLKSSSFFKTKKKKILVVGQVKNDASIKYGTFFYKNELKLIKKIRQDNINAFIIYKPHPDVLSLNKTGEDIQKINKYLDFVDYTSSLFDCLNAVDEVHTLTSLVGFDALIRGKKVFTYGAPFYAGWGLTIDMDKTSPAFKRRKRKLSLEELVYGCLIKYPIYWDYEKNKMTTCEHVIRQIVKERDAYWKVNTKSPIEKPYLIRQIKKGLILAKSYFV